MKTPLFVLMAICAALASASCAKHTREVTTYYAPPAPTDVAVDPNCEDLSGVVLPDAAAYDHAGDEGRAKINSAYFQLTSGLDGMAWCQTYGRTWVQYGGCLENPKHSCREQDKRVCDSCTKYGSELYRLARKARPGFGETYAERFCDRY
jgi:hypothetical protein